jgi:hypothetical protein
MFTREGSERSYRRLNPDWGAAEVEKALQWLDQRRENMLQALLPAPGGRLVALHNNARGYSIETEVPISDQLSLPRRKESAHEFFLCTSAKDFDVLCQSPYNVVLQSTGKGEEDGSLSRLCARRGIRYVNLEVALGKTVEQREMLEWAEKHLP